MSAPVSDNTTSPPAASESALDRTAHAAVHPRYSGIARLYGQVGLDALQKARVAIIGIGGVGSWVAEALARSGVGAIDLVDLDDICVTNTNRQLHTLATTVGQPKVEAMAERLRAIDPAIQVRCVHDFFTAKSAEAIVTSELSFVVDAIDGADSKCQLILRCREVGVPLVVLGGAGGRRDPTQVKVADLTESEGDRLLARVRKQLRQKHDFSRRGKWHLAAVYSPEPQVFPSADGGVCESRDEAATLRLDCATGFGTAAFITGTFGLVAASVVVEALVDKARKAAPASLVARSAAPVELVGEDEAVVVGD